MLKKPTTEKLRAMRLGAMAAAWNEQSSKPEIVLIAPVIAIDWFRRSRCAGLVIAINEMSHSLSHNVAATWCGTSIQITARSVRRKFCLSGGRARDTYAALDVMKERGC